MNGPRNKWNLGREGAFPGKSPSQRDPYRDLQATYQGGYQPASGPKGPATSTAHQIQFGPIDIRAFNVPYEAARIPTPNVKSGQLLIAIEDRFTISGGDNKFDFTSCEVSVFGWNSGIKQLVKRQWVRTSTGPFRWVWNNDGDQFDSLSVELFPYLFGSEPSGGLFPAGDAQNIIQALSATGVWRYVTTTPAVPVTNQAMGKGG